MAIYFVDSTTGDDGDSGLTMDLAWATLEHALEAGALNAGDVIFVRRIHNEVLASDINCVYDATASSPIKVIGWPRAAHSVASADFTNGSTSVNVDDNDMDREKHQGRFLTGPDGKDYLITRVVDSATIILDREYAGSTAANAAATIKADEDWVDDMGTAYGFDDSGWVIQETDWDADADDLPVIDFNSGAFMLDISSDLYYEIKNIEFKNSNDTYCIYLSSANTILILGCLIKQSDGNNHICIGVNGGNYKIERCILEGGGNVADTSQNGLSVATNSHVILNNVAIYNMGNSGIISSNENLIELNNVNIGVELANKDDDIIMGTGLTIKAVDVKLGGTNGYISYPYTFPTNTLLLIENYQKVLGKHYTFYPVGTWEKIAVAGETPNKKLSDDVLKISPNVANINTKNFPQEIFCHEFDATTDSLTYKYWLYNDTGDTLNDGDAKGSIWLEAQYVNSYDDTTEYTQAKVYSSENTIADAADADDWDYLSVTVQPAVASRVRIKCFCRHYTAAGDIFIDPAIVIS